jgi:phosphoglycerate dehydrogenase-like enzyme
MPTDGTLIASQLGTELDEALAAHPSRPRLLPVPEERPWEIASEADYLFVRPGSAWAAAPVERPAAWPGRLRWVQTATAGIDAFPAWLADGVAVSCARGVFSQQIADYVMAAVYAAAKPLETLAPRGPEDWEPKTLRAVSGATMGIIGLGSIGTAVARRAIGNEMAVVAARRRRSLAADVDGVELLEDLPSLFSRSDHVVLALPETPETRGIVDASLLAAAKPGLHLINVGRGSAIDEDALLKALDDARIGRATLDVTAPEPPPAGSRLYTHPSIRLTPHLAQNFLLARPRLHELILSNHARMSEGLEPFGLVDPALGY